MIAEGIIFDKPFDMSSYTREEILERYSPFSNVTEWERERLEHTSSEIELQIDKDKVVTKDMVILKFHPDEKNMLMNLYMTTGIIDVICPRLGRVDLLDSGAMLFSYPYFPEDKEYSKKIEDAIQELFRVSLFFLEESGPQDLSRWRNRLLAYTNTYISYVDRKSFGNIGNKKIVKRIYRKFL